MLVLISLLLLGGASARRPCERKYWRGQCTACPGYWYQSCPNGDPDIGQRGCGFLGCETECKDPDGNGYDYGCGCGKGQGCLKKDCKVSAFGEWGNCSEECGGGKQSRTRSVTEKPANGGAACPALREERGCNTDDCDSTDEPTGPPTEKPTVSPTPEPTAPSKYIRSEGYCRKPGRADVTAGAKLFKDRNCEARCNAQATCTGYGLPKRTKLWYDFRGPQTPNQCETYTSRGAYGWLFEQDYWCYMKRGMTPAPTTPDEVDCPEKKYVNTSFKISRGDRHTIKLNMEGVDPMCECYFKCKIERYGDMAKYYYSFWEYKTKRNEAVCTCYEKHRGKRIKIKNQKGVTSGYLTEEGMQQIKKSQGGRRRRRRRRRRG